MATMQLRNMGNWTRKAKARALFMVQETTREMGMVGQRTQRNGGKLPYLSGALQRSFAGHINGAQVSVGIDAHFQAAMSLKLGDVIKMTWGNEEVDYARRQNSGFIGTDKLGRNYNEPGKHWLEYTVAQFGPITARAAMEAIRKFP